MPRIHRDRFNSGYLALESSLPAEAEPVIDELNKLTNKGCEIISSREEHKQMVLYRYGREEELEPIKRIQSGKADVDNILAEFVSVADLQKSHISISHHKGGVIYIAILFCMIHSLQLIIICKK